MLNINRTHNRTLTLAAPYQPTYPPGIFRARKYGDPVMVALMGLDTVSMGTTNFQNIDLFHPDPGAGFGGVSKFQKLGPAQMDYLKRIQPVDVGPFNTKMNFLCGNKDVTGNPERPYWTTGGDWFGTWETFRFGTIVFGGQLVQVETDAAGQPRVFEFEGKFQSRATKERIQFYRLQGMRWSERDAVTHQSHPWKIQRATWADWGNNYRDTWHSGAVYHPVWDPFDFPCNYDGGYGPALYLATAFVEQP